MSTPSEPAGKISPRSLHRLGVTCGFAAGAWLGAAEAPTKLVTAGFSPFVISLGTVLGVFVARWTVPMALKGTGYVWVDIKKKPHLIIWALLAGALWAVANTLTVFAIRDVGLSIAFPLWNTNSLIGLLWGWLLFGELAGADRRHIIRVSGGAAAMAVGACLLAFSTSWQASIAPRAAATGIAAALGAALLWGTMYVPYRKAYLSGMNPLSFVTIFAFGQTATVLLLTLAFEGGIHHLAAELLRVRPVLFWLFLGGFCWVIGDLFQHYAAKYVGIGRGIPLSNTNQIWGLAWGALVFGEMNGAGLVTELLIGTGSLVMLAGAWAISLAEAPEGERAAWRSAADRECRRYGLDVEQVTASLEGTDPLSREESTRSWWELAIVAAAIGVFVSLGLVVKRPAISADLGWIAVLVALCAAFLGIAGSLLWRRTRFS